MKVLGFRGDPKASRYAVVSQNNGQYVLENASGDNKLTIPASIEEEAVAERLEWLYNEILRILRTHHGISKVVIKANEFTQQDTKGKRRSAYNDAAVLLACKHRNVLVMVRTYAFMGTKGATTKHDAEVRVGKTDKYWDNKMADAVNAAWWGLPRS